jgi:hypothetical protein
MLRALRSGWIEPPTILNSTEHKVFPYRVQAILPCLERFEVNPTCAIWPDVIARPVMTPAFDHFAGGHRQQILSPHGSALERRNRPVIIEVFDYRIEKRVFRHRGWLNSARIYHRIEDARRRESTILGP